MISSDLSQTADLERDRVRASIAKKRDGVVSPFFEVLLECPAIAEAASDMGAAIRFSGSLPAPLRELAICTVAAHWNADYEWKVHSELASKAGIAADVLDAVRERRALAGNDLAQRAVHAFMAELLRDGRASVRCRQQVVDLLGHKQAVELAAIAGYFGLLSFVLNTFE